MSTPHAPIRTYLISGFLGAGKTTFILEHLKRAGARVAVLVNEFGELGVDGALIRAGGGLDVIELPGGCICCSQKDGLEESIRRISAQLRPELLLIEPSGIAESSELLKVLAGSSLAGVIRLDAVLAVIDAETFLEFSGPDGFGAFFLDQVANADLILVNKADLVEADMLAGIERRIAEISPGALVQRTAFCRMDGELPNSRKGTPGGPGGALHGIECVSVVPGSALSDNELVQFLSELSEGRFGRVVRGKGLFPVDGKGFLNLQIVAGRVALEPFAANAAARMTLIGYALNGDRLRDFFSRARTGKENQ